MYPNTKNDRRIGERGNFPESIGLCAGGYQSERQVSLDIRLDRGRYFLVPSTYYPQKHLQYILIVWHQAANRALVISELV
ncbi:MAG: hypothetical protein P4M11_07560 [Candidatus Pacebacteria bacterium]|nr:hypothetical protein [Candidatus Paceibacterota bacterium]